MNEYGQIIGDGAVRFERLLPGPLERVWQYLTDSQLRANHLLVALRVTDIEITVATTPDELRRATEEEHDLAVVDVEANELPGVLAALRATASHAEVPILVEISRVAHTPHLSGVMPRYRAMPCSPTELVVLARRRIAAMTTESGTVRGAVAT